MKVTVQNAYHNTRAVVCATPGNALTRRQVERTKRALCGVRGCLCSGPLGTRGTQTCNIIADYDAFGAETYYVSAR